MLKSDMLQKKTSAVKIFASLMPSILESGLPEGEHVPDLFQCELQQAVPAETRTAKLSG